MLAARIGRMSEHVSAQRRSEFRVKRLELSQRIDRELSFLPGTTDVFDQAARELQLLERRVDLIARIDDRLRRIEHLGSEGPSRVLGRLAERLVLTSRLLGAERPEPGAFEVVEKAINAADVELVRIESEDEVLRKAILDEATSFWKDYFEPLWRALPEDSAWVNALRTKMGAFVAHADDCFRAGRHQAGAWPRSTPRSRS